MTPVVFRKYGVNGGPVHIIVERITHWEKVSYNGISGTLIHLDTGESVTVDAWADDVSKKVTEATKG